MFRNYLTKGITSTMEEQQIRDFVHRVTTEETLRNELATDPKTVIAREGFSSRVEQVVMRLVPHLTIDKPLDTGFSWWNSHS